MVKLSDGRELAFDLMKMTHREYKSLFDPKVSDEVDYKTIEKVCGMPAKEVGDLPQPDYRRLIQGLVAKAQAPLADPNSQSVSTSQS